MSITIIRRAADADIPALARLYTEFHAFHVAGVPDRLRGIAGQDDGNALLAALRALLADPTAALIVAETDGALTGLAEVYVREDASHPLTVAHRYGYLQSLVVMAAARRQGLGARLTAAAEQWAARQGATEMQLDSWEFTAGPVPFYEAQGYRTLKRKLVKPLTGGSGDP